MVSKDQELIHVKYFLQDIDDKPERIKRFVESNNKGNIVPIYSVFVIQYVQRYLESEDEDGTEFMDWDYANMNS